MSYNPARMQEGFSTQRRSAQRYSPNGGGVKRSEFHEKIVHDGVHFEDLTKRERIDTGWRLQYFSNDEFEVVYEFICSKNAFGQVVNKTKDRVIRVLSGILNITLDGEYVQFSAGQVAVLKKGAIYELSTLGSMNVEIIKIQHKDYENTLELMTEKVIGNTRLPVEPKRFEVVTHDRPDSKAVVQAQAMAEEKSTRLRGRMKASSRAPLPGQNMPGENLRPTGGAGYEE